jgi:hypothetical protein
MPIILATWEAEIWKIMVRGQPTKKKKTLSQWGKAGCGGAYLSSKGVRKMKIGGL